MWWEIFIYLTIAFVVELLGNFIYDKIVEKVKWKPFEKDYEHAKKYAEKGAFLIIPDGKIKSFYLIIWLAFLIFMFLGIILGVALYFSGEANFTVSFLSGLIMMLIALPWFLYGFYLYTKKILFYKDKFIIKTIFYVKEINLTDIWGAKIDENQYTHVYNIIIYYKNRKLKIYYWFSNIDLAKEVLMNSVRIIDDKNE